MAEDQAAEEYLASLDDDEFTKLLARVRPPGSTTGPGTLAAGAALYDKQHGQTIKVEGAEQTIKGRWS